MSIAKLFIKVFEEDIFSKFGTTQKDSDDDEDTAVCVKETPIKIVGVDRSALPGSAAAATQATTSSLSKKNSKAPDMNVTE